MLRTRLFLLLALLFAVSLLTLFGYSISIAAPFTQESSQAGDDGQEYVVQSGDWLSKISQKFYGSTSAWQIIVDATNAKAETNPRFTVIDDPDQLEVGQLLWIPNLPSESESEPGNGANVTDTVAAGEAISDTDHSESMAVTATVRFVQPQAGDVLPPRFDVTMAAEGLTIEPAGEIHEAAGHFHILLDTDFVPPGELLPFDENHLHFGRGQLTTTLELEPGLHSLRLQFANGAHIALEGEQYHDTITVTVGTTTTTIASTTGLIATPATVTTTTAMTEETLLPTVQFVEPLAGDVVASRFDVIMAAEGLTVEPAGEIHEGTGHFHILVDTNFIAPGELLPFDENHLHFGRGQLTTTLELEPGLHSLRLQFANGAHIALEGEQYHDTITITVGSGD